MTNKILTKREITKFVLPSILLMMFISVYVLVDSVFISRYVGQQALAGQNIVAPLYTVAFAVGIMFATGGGALIAIKMGRGDSEEANYNFTSLLVIGIVFGIIATIVCLIFKNSIVSMLGGKGMLLHYGSIYSTYIIIAIPFLINKVIFESLLRVDGNPSLALLMSIVGGITNIVLDYIFMAIMDMGIAGAGLGTLIGIVVSILIGYVHFLSSRSNLKIRFRKPDFKFVFSTVTNGSSEMVNEIAIAMTTIIYNMLTLKYIGENGVSAITIILGINFLFASIFVGFSMGVAPLISYNYGAKNENNICKILRYSRVFILVASVISFIVAFVAAEPLVSIYTDRTEPVYGIAVDGLKLFAIVFIFVGTNIFSSGLFTAFGNGKVSAIISFIKSFGFFIVGAIVLPLVFKADGIFLIQPFAELMCIGVVIYFLKKYQDVYGYKLKR
jgi:putative MATE family efflux protein